MAAVTEHLGLGRTCPNPPLHFGPTFLSPSVTWMIEIIILCPSLYCFPSLLFSSLLYDYSTYSLIREQTLGVTVLGAGITGN